MPPDSRTVSADQVGHLDVVHDFGPGMTLEQVTSEKRRDFVTGNKCTRLVHKGHAVAVTIPGNTQRRLRSSGFRP